MIKVTEELFRAHKFINIKIKRKGEKNRACRSAEIVKKYIKEATTEC